MIAEVMGTVEKGALKLDGALPFPDHMRVKLIVEPVEAENPSQAAWEQMKDRIRKHPIRGLGGRFSREELHERD